MKEYPSLESAIEQFDRESVQERLEKAETQRQAILSSFPRDQWHDLDLNDYALGPTGNKQSYSYLLEYASQSLGGVKGGSASKWIIYKPKKKPGWFYPSDFENEQEAWTELRGGLLKLFTLAEEGKWDSVDGVPILRTGTVLRIKSLHVYFPNEVLPIYSLEHVKHFLNLLNLPVESGYTNVRYNRKLLEFFQSDERFNGWSTVEIMYFLYGWAHPKKAPKVFKIAPGEDARLWDDCRDNSYIRIGWGEVGDLSEFENKAEFKETFKETFDYTTSNKASQKANELWRLMELETGDVVVANWGISHVLAVGTVNDTGYQYLEELEEYQHTLGIDWDTSFAKDISPQRSWAFLTVAKIKPAVYKEIMSGESTPNPDDEYVEDIYYCLLYTSPSPRDKRQSRMPSSA